MWQFRFDSQIFDRVVQLTHTKSAAERGDAAFALTDIRKRNLDGSRKAFLALVGDTSSDVRCALHPGWLINWIVRTSSRRSTSY